MTKQTHQIILFAICALISYGIWKYFFDREKFTQDKPFTKGYSIENIELKITDESGNFTARFTSPNLIRYTDSPVLFIKSPLFWTYKEGKEHWLLESNNAEYNTDKEQVEFSEKVIAHTVNQEQITSFEANSLLVNLKNNNARTNNGVEFKQHHMKMTGQIAQFDLIQETLEVNKNVKAIYKSQYKN